MEKIAVSPRTRTIEAKWNQALTDLLYSWHWKENLKHAEIATRVGVPRPTVTRWFKQLHVPTQSCTRFTNANLLNVGPRKTPPAKPSVERESPWKFNRTFFQKWSPEMAYVLGFLFADGYVFTNPRGSSYLCFASTDREIIQAIKVALRSNHTIGSRIRSVPSGNRKRKKLYVLQIGSKEVVKSLERFGIVQNKSLVIRFPKNIPRLYFGNFVRGYFDGDGCVYFKQHMVAKRKKMRWVFQVHFTSGSLAFLIGLKKALMPYTKGGFIQHKQRGYELIFSHHDGFALYKLMYHTVPNGLLLTRKYKIFQKAAATLCMGP